MEQTWEQMVKRANSLGTIDTDSGELRIKDRRPCLSEVIERICQSFFSRYYLMCLLYTRAGSEAAEGWDKAQEWSTKWIEALEMQGTRELPGIDVNAGFMIRDALNAGWLCRASRPADVTRIEPALRKLLSDILGEQRNSGAGRGAKRTKQPRPI